jgi:hypothetical protein
LGTIFPRCCFLDNAIIIKTDQGDETEGLEMEGLEAVIKERGGEGIIIV